MAAPMTELLFVFLFGIASWSSCGAENTATLTGISCEPAGDNEVVSSWDCNISENFFDTSVIVKAGCPGVVESNTDILKDGNVLNSVQKSHAQVIQDIQDLNICPSIEGPDPDDGCSAAEGEVSAESCDLTSFFKDMDVGNYETRTEFSIGGEAIAFVKLQVKVEGE